MERDRRSAIDCSRCDRHAKQQELQRQQQQDQAPAGQEKL